MGGTITLSAPSPNTFSPLDLSGAGFSTEATVLPLIYSQLVVLAAGDDRDAHRAVAEGDLASGWEWPDARTLVFQLRRDAEWPEEGANAAAPLTASDVGRSHDLYRSGYSPHAELYRAVERIDADDAAATVAFHLSEPAAYLLPSLTSPHQVVMPPEWEAGAPPMFNSASRGTGPFRLQHHGGPLSSWSVVRRSDYFQATPDMDAPFVSQVHGGILASRSSDNPFSAPREALLADWLSGRLDAIPLVHPAELDEALRPVADAVMQVSPPVPGTAPTIYFDWASADIADPRVRRALSMALDRQRLIDELHGGLGRAGLRHAVELRCRRGVGERLPRMALDARGAGRAVPARPGRGACAARRRGEAGRSAREAEAGRARRRAAELRCRRRRGYPNSSKPSPDNGPKRWAAWSRSNSFRAASSGKSTAARSSFPCRRAT